MHGLLRPALQVLSRELVNQYNIGDLRKNLTPRDGDLELLLDASGATDETGATISSSCCATASTHLDCAFGALLIPEKKIALAALRRRGARSDARAAGKTQRHLFAWAQVQRRTLMMNKPPPQQPVRQRCRTRCSRVRFARASRT